MRGSIFGDIRHHPLKAQLLVPLDRISVLFVEKQLAMDLQAPAVVLADAGHEEIKPEPIQDPEADQGPSDGGDGEPRGGGSGGGGGGAVGGGDPGGDEGEDEGDGEDEGGGEADVGVHEGFLAPFAPLGEAEIHEAEAEEGAEEGVDGIAVEADEDAVGVLRVFLGGRGEDEDDGYGPVDG